MPPSTIAEAVAALEASRGKRITERLRALNLDPRTDLAGGDWRNCDFSYCDLAECDFRNARLYRADFSHADVAGADFTGATDIHTAKIQKATNWRNATFTTDQLILIEARMSELAERARAHLEPPQWVALIRDAKDYRDATALLAEMDQTEHVFNKFAYSAAMNKARSAEECEHARALFRTFLNSGGEPDLPMFTTAAGICDDSSQARSILAAAEQFDLDPDNYLYNKVISRQDEFRVAMHYFGEMVDRGVTINAFTGYALLDACENLAHAMTVLMKMHEHGVDVFTIDFITDIAGRTARPEITIRNAFNLMRDGCNERAIMRHILDAVLLDPFRQTVLAGLGLG